MFGTKKIKAEAEAIPGVTTVVELIQKSPDKVTVVVAATPEAVHILPTVTTVAARRVLVRQNIASVAVQKKPLSKASDLLMTLTDGQVLTFFGDRGACADLAESLAA